jgi:hypothetical protein
MRDGIKIIQPMIFTHNHPTNPNQPKGIKAVLEERGLWVPRLCLECKKPKCEVGATSCCARRLLGQQPDFQEQKSLVQEVIEATGHLCIFLPKFHCELNFIEFFWGAVKKYLCDHCDHTFDTLKENLPKALASVDVKTIRKWEHRTMRWLDAYGSGKGTKEAQLHVKQFSSCKYTSHRRIPQSIATLMDN